ncbi:hypothetical protein DFR70_103345 [Nocardia tenerifensis]|uniref:Uncharacterized protein n=1 Tax=Nocardia tenerifensis TaxID=228006 RepID=A0A318K9B0_9NOCA|nr:DUF6301 family protein [Nocardia tenerifensis]PXX66596.1 hypothetical protein DFR70_103345 [Nocardia tenerifensis]
MTEWRALTDEEIVDLGTRLRALKWSWQMDDAPQVAAEFGWEIAVAEPKFVMFDAIFGFDTAGIIGWDGRADFITVEVTGGGRDESPGQSNTRDAFVRMSRALTAALGEPSTRKPGSSPEIRWAGPETTLVLQRLKTMIELTLFTNAKLALHDQAIELEGRDAD